MPLIKLKTYKPVCDKCGVVGSTWTNIEPGSEEKVIPPGWASGVVSDSHGIASPYIMCGRCWYAFQQTPLDERQAFTDPPGQIEMPENDSRA